MRPITVRMGAAGNSSWIRCDANKRTYQAGLGFVISSGASLTGVVQHTFDNYYDKQPVKFSRVTTTATMLKVAHGLSVGDYVTAEAAAPFAGEYAVASVVDADNITYTVVDSGATAADGVAGTARVFDHETMTGMTSNTDGNYAFPPFACRLRLSSYSSGTADLLYSQAG